MDFVGGFPMSRKGHDYLYVVIDHLSKMCILMPCKNAVTVEKTSYLFFQFVLGPLLVSHIDCVRSRLSLPWRVLDQLLANGGHQVEEKYNIPSTNRWTDRGHQPYCGTFIVGLLQKTSQVVG